MTLPVTARKDGPYSCNGSLVDFDFNFKVFTEADVAVILTDSNSIDSTLTLTSNYTVALNADQENNPGGTITTVATYATGNTITIIGNLDYGQPTELTNRGGFFPKVIERAMDRLGILIQQLLEKTNRALSLSPATASGVSTELPPPEASALIGWSAGADELVNYAGTSSVLVSVPMEPVVGAATLGSARSQLGAAASGTNTDITSVYLDNTGLKIKDTNASHGVSIVPGSNVTADRTLTIITGDADRQITLNGNTTLTGTNTGDQSAASQAEQEAGTEAAKFVAPLTQQYHASSVKGWNSLNGTGTAASRAAYNTTITDNGTGDYTFTFTTNFSSANYAAVGMCGRGSAGGGSGVHTLQIHNNVNPTASALRVQSIAAGSTADLEYVNIASMGDQ